MTKSKWWKNAIIYQIYPRSFFDSNNDGIGDLNGIYQKLDYIKNLGIDAIWLSPIYDSPNADNGYDISDYRNIMKEFGTMADFDSLIIHMHNLGIKLIMDLVINHTSDEHPWFIQSRSSIDNPYRDFYLWRTGKDGNPPSDAQAMFGKSAWEYDKFTDEYYYHLFTKKQPDLNWDNPKVIDEVIKICEFWIEKGVDGFRIDCANLLGKNTSFPTIGKCDDFFKKQDKLIFNNSKNHEYYRILNERVFSKYDIVTFGECTQVNTDIGKLYVDPNRKELDGIIQFEHVKLDDGPNGEKWVLVDYKPQDLKRSFATWQTALEGHGWNALYLDNHDQPRLVSRFGNDKEFREISAKLFATMLLTLKGTPFIYQGTEIGMSNLWLEFDEMDDCEAKTAYEENNRTHAQTPEQLLKAINKRGRDNSRTPMQWSNNANGGFTLVTPWFKVNPNYINVNVEKDLKDKNSIFYYYQLLIKIRHSTQLYTLGKFDEYLVDNTSVFAYTREFESEKALILLNLTANDTFFEFPLFSFFGNAKIEISNYSNIKLSKQMSLRPYEAIVLRK